MTGQGDLFDLEILTYRPSDHIETREHVKQVLRPLAVELRRQNANLIGAAEGFQFFAAEFQAEAQRQLTED